ncbi:hypothetical protein P174DRAFT_479443 [Aspergillus novofumigatus IBT 16806]|uniref:Uncharacterized protein n=1 Tax=Aspergillus novofumigatus (strain IBT 16806) TaxID=1392255 RepID=A0A2I1BSD6_ASPN1|nr:hypothetical protein P174DRAFT_479443 [Aspergillus novofumigatus IBT 16806]
MTISTPVSVCPYIYLHIYISIYLYIYIGRYGTGGPCRPGSVQMSGGCMHARGRVRVYIYIYICIRVSVSMDGWMPPGGPCRRMSRPMTMCVSLQVSVYGARGSPVPIRARAGQLVTPGARAPGLYRPRCLCVSTSVCLWRAPLPAGLPPKGPRQLVTGPPSTNPSAPDPGPRAAPPTAPTRPANWPPPSPPRAHLRASPPSLPPSSPRSRAHPCRSSPAPAPGPYDGARARGSLLATSARAPAQLPSTSTSSTPRARASDGPSLTHTHRPRPAPHRAGKRSRVRKSFRGRPTFAGRPRASHAAMCPGQLATALRHQAAARAGPAAGQGARPAISDRQLAWSHGGWRSEGTGRRRSPASPEKGVWPPPSARRCRTRWWEVFANKSSQGSG